jgi:hypothetical protein
VSVKTAVVFVVEVEAELLDPDNRVVARPKFPGEMRPMPHAPSHRPPLPVGIVATYIRKAVTAIAEGNVKRGTSSVSRSLFHRESQ